MCGVQQLGISPLGEQFIKMAVLTCYKQFGTNSIILLMFVESQRAHTQSTCKVGNKNLECCSVKKKYIYSYLKRIVYAKLLKPRQSFRINLHIAYYIVSTSISHKILSHIHLSSYITNPFPHIILNLRSKVFPEGFPTKIIHTFLVSPVSTTFFTVISLT